MNLDDLEELLLLPNNWRVTHLIELIDCWQAIATDDVNVVVSTGGSIAEAIANVQIKTETGPFDKFLLGAKMPEASIESTKLDLTALFTVQRPPINRRI